MKDKYFKSMEGFETTGAYRCDNCNQIWGFFAEDYESPDEWPSICPHCSMTFWEMVTNVFKQGGFKEVIFWIVVRYF